MSARHGEGRPTQCSRTPVTSVRLHASTSVDDVYPLLEDGQHIITDWLRDGFKALGFRPPDREVGELKLRTEDDGERLAMEDFGKLYDRVRSYAATRQWKPGNGSRIELYLERHPTSPVGRIFISPDRGALRARFTPRTEALFDDVRSRVLGAVQHLAGDVTIETGSGNWDKVKVPIVVVTAPLRSIIGQGVTADEQEERLLQFAAPLVTAVSEPTPGTSMPAMPAPSRAPRVRRRTL